MCNHCLEKNKRLEVKIKALMSEIDTETLFVTYNEMKDKLTVYAGGSVCDDEFDCVCDVNESSLT